ncbi:MAG: riboflavin synthase [Planctomycetota bacterium]
MFTGIVRHIARVVSCTETATGRRLVLDPLGWDHRPEPGDSIACSGCCLTLVEPVGSVGGMFTFDAIPETLAKTTLGGWAADTRINLEPAARMGDRLDGHIVQGHVDCVGKVVSVDQSEGWRVRVSVPAEMGRYLVPKGSITVDGVSLTLAGTGAVKEGTPWFEVALIPETLERTTLDGLSVGDRVNIECDITAKTVAHMVEHYTSNTTNDR